MIFIHFFSCYNWENKLLIEQSIFLPKETTIEETRGSLYKLPHLRFDFCVIIFEPIDVQICSAPQIDRLNLSFVKDDEKLARNGQKMAIWAGGWGRLPMTAILSSLLFVFTVKKCYLRRLSKYYSKFDINSKIHVGDTKDKNKY